MTAAKNSHPNLAHTDPLVPRLNALRGRMAQSKPRPLLGAVRAVTGAVLHATFPRAAVGSICAIRQAHAESLAEVISAEADTAILSPFGGASGLHAGLAVRCIARELLVPVGKSLLGRVVNGLGRPIDGLGPLADTTLRPARSIPTDPLDRPLIDVPLSTGLRALDAFCTIGKGQRLGIFGPPGAGKSVLMAALARNCHADAIVIGLVGERGREVREFIDRALPSDHRTRTVVVAATSDRPPLERLYAAQTATAIAEDLRDAGLSVLLLIDSLTRVARALREIGLAAGEPPTRRGYPASVYAALPQLIERSGRTARGDITSLYTVLVEGDGEGDPIAEEVRSLTDGHIILNPAIAARGRFPAIDVMTSLSRLMADLASPENRRLASRARASLAKYAEIELLLQVGEYRPGSDPEADRAIAVYPALEAFLAQSVDEPASDAARSWDMLARALDRSGTWGPR
jgi:ATP synthase in type III secretion protein N